MLRGATKHKGAQENYTTNIIKNLFLDINFRFADCVAKNVFLKRKEKQAHIFKKPIRIKGNLDVKNS